jgi:hypothetical protein
VANDGNDFMSAVYSGDTLYTVWGDSRSGKLNIWFAKTIASTNTTVDLNVLNEGNDIFQVFPNPAQQQLKISILQAAGLAPIEIYNLEGQKVFSKVPTKMQDEIDISNIKSGVYLVKLGAQLKRIVISK